MGLQIFVCERRQLTLSTAGCSRLYVSANTGKRPDAWEGRSACVSCPIGSANSGKPQNAVSALTELLRMLCPRCGRRADRLIWGRLCPSCDARQLEARAGRNAKGTRPALSGRLHTQRIAVSGETTPTPRVVTSRSVATLQEAIIHMSKSATGSAAYGRRSVQFPRIRQYEMGI